MLEKLSGQFNVRAYFDVFWLRIETEEVSDRKITIENYINRAQQVGK